jgi:trehalose-6-phosphate synthase
MRLSLRFIIPLIIVLSVIAYGVLPLVDKLTVNWFIRDIDTRTHLLHSTMQDALVPLVESGNAQKVQQLFSRATEDERLYGVGFCDLQGKIVYKTLTCPASLKCDPALTQPRSLVADEQNGALHFAFFPLESEGRQIGQLILVHDLSFIRKRSADTRLYIFYFFIGLSIVIAALTVLIAQLSWKGWVNSLRGVLKGGRLFRPTSSKMPQELRPLVKDLRYLIRDLEQERRAAHQDQITWTPTALKEILRNELAGDEILIVSNREPYIHNKSKNGEIKVQVPASGLVTALEPIMRACSGTWIAHGAGSADRETVDSNDRVRVPPENPSYNIRRVWLSPEEENGYYYGFANEGLWALCHIAHVRPIFRSQDWAHYKAVNQKFADAVVREAKTDNPVVLVQDYHFALAPKMIREQLPKATVITFWHIPFPNSEVFGICPWREEILEGLLGSSILGFHTRFHCHNFFDAVDRFMESRIDRDSSTISFHGKLTAVRPYPISIEYPVKWLHEIAPVADCRKAVRERHGYSPDLLLGIGVDRLDYTKGILERFMAVERLLELEPQWIGKFTFVQIAAPSRSSIAQYQHFDSEVRALAEKINQRFGRDGYKPIELLIEHHGPKDVYEYYRASEICFVSSLHDGMNLVAKEYLASRDDDRGVLILSQFAGAARELPEALIVNPYNIDQCAGALSIALTMPAQEQRDRMRSMRALIQEHNVYRWAGKMLLDAAKLRQRDRVLGSHERPHTGFSAANSLML